MKHYFVPIELTQAYRPVSLVGKKGFCNIKWSSDGGDANARITFKSTLD
ncbi:hypothetical protein [Terrimonas pollutisoli]|nr:hypothetical protein [Terrimonas sp. H1YJ31]